MTVVGRGISPEFERQLTHGILLPILERVRHDDTLSLEVRNGYVNVYYRGGNLLKITAKNEASSFSTQFDWRYCGSESDYSCALCERPPAAIQTDADACAWVDAFSFYKQAMDIHFSKRPKIEREYQQSVVRDNNRHTTGDKSDYVILDIEYTQSSLAFPGRPVGFRFDMVGLRWPVAGGDRRSGVVTPFIMEMKAGDGAIRSVGSGRDDGMSAGLAKHVNDIERFLAPEPDRSISKPYGLLRDELRAIFETKQRLQLPSIPKRMAKLKITEMSERPEVIFVLANHQPASSILATELEGMPPTEHADYRVATASHVGYALFHQNVVSLAEFVKRLKEEARFSSAGDV